MKRIWVLMLAALMLVFGVQVAMADYSMPVADGDLDPFQGLDENWINVLLIGTDTRENNLMSGRADTMMVCSLHRQTGQARITSLSRDILVTMGNNGHQNRLNAAHTYGGANLLMQTINRTFDLNIEYYVTVNFYGICDIVDALGGVTVEMSSEEVGTVNRTVEEEYGDVEVVPLQSGEGLRTLCGAQALSYARIRALDNDFERQNRQRKILLGMADQIMECSIFGIVDVIKTCLNFVKTNLPITEIVPLAIGVIDHGVSELNMRGIPQEGEYKYESHNGASVLIIDEEEITQVIHQFIYE